MTQYNVHIKKFRSENANKPYGLLNSKCLPSVLEVFFELEGRFCQSAHIHVESNLLHPSPSTVAIFRRCCPKLQTSNGLPVFLETTNIFLQHIVNSISPNARGKMIPKFSKDVWDVFTLLRCQNCLLKSRFCRHRKSTWLVHFQCYRHAHELTVMLG